MYKHWRVRTIEIAISIIFCATIAFSSWQSVSAQDRKYAGNSRANTYGIKALIYTPGLPPYLEGTPYQSGEDNFISVQYDDWVQTGWRYYLGWSAAHTYVEHKVGSYYGENSYEDQGWGTTIQYQVDCGNCSLSTWYAYIAGVNKGGWGPIAAPRNVLASSEIHFNWNNGLDVRFASVNYLSTNYTWQLFDQANWIEDFPYQVQKDYLYNYRTYRYSASDQVIVQLRVDQSSVANSRDYIVKIDSLSPLPNSDLSAAHSQGWLGVFLAPNSGNFTQTGFLGDRNGPRWFVYAPTLGVYCTRGITVWDRHGCLGQPYDYAALDSYQQVELVTYGQGFWIARIYDVNNNATDVARIYSNSQTIYGSQVSIEEAYSVSPDPLVSVRYFHFHPKYMIWGSGFQDWPASSSPNNNFLWVYPQPPGSPPNENCPPGTPYGAIIFGDPRNWYGGTYGTTCYKNPIF